MASKYQSEDTTFALSAGNEICYRCAAIPWYRLALLDPPPAEDGLHITEIADSHDTLSCSSCSICQLLATIKPKNLALFPRRAKGGAHEPPNGNIDPCRLTLFSADDMLDSCEKRQRPQFVDILGGSGKVLGVTFGADEMFSWSRESSCMGIDHARRPRNFGLRKVNPDQADFDMIESLVSNCLETHGETCEAPQTALIPNFRLIDCSRTPPIVIESSSKCTYAALSYVWESKVWNGPGFPLIVADAISATQKMGFRYLWVDRYVRLTGISELAVYTELMDTRIINSE